MKQLKSFTFLFLFLLFHLFRHRNVTSSSQTTSVNQPINTPFMQFPSTQFMPGMSFTSNQPQTRLTAEQYALAQQMAMQNMMHQMYLQYMNYYANLMQSNSQDNNQFTQPMSWPNFMATMNATNAIQQTTERNADVEQRNQQQIVNAAAQQIVNDDDAENRDWLEILYTFSRLIVLLSLVYFYSSPGRCSIVIFVMVLYYL